jgi:hypothetical protein
MVRPQEMMYTPLHLKLYRRHGIESISLFYSAVPFNTFSNFIPLLPIEQRFNPLTLTYPGIQETLTLVPAHNHGDLADNVSLRWWLKRLRRKQLALAEPTDFLLLLDADADDDYWWGYNWPVLNKLLAQTRGLRGLVESVCDLDFVAFTTPCEYVRTHPPLGVVSIGQDTADGGFDGMCSWAEKWSNHQLWTGVERSRILELQTRRLGGSDNQELERLVQESFDARLKALSTTHFGLSSPVMNRTRLRTASELVRVSVDKAAQAFELAAPGALGETDGAGFALFDYARGVSTQDVEYEVKPSRALVRVPLAEPLPNEVRLVGADGKPRPACVRRAELLFVESIDGGERKDFYLSDQGGEDFTVPNPVTATPGVLQNEFITLRFDGAMQPVSLVCQGLEWSDGPFLRSAINYAGRVAEVSRWTLLEASVLGEGLLGWVKVRGEIPFRADGEKRVEVERELLLVSGLPHLYAYTRIAYPQTRSNKFNKKRAQRLEQEYDGHWREVMPCEIRPALFGRPLRVWKHNYLGHVSHYDLNYGEFSRNRELDSFNNHVTHAWVAVSDREKGLLAAQTADVNASFAFCPMRTRGARIFLNPFGTYFGKQLRYATAFSGLGKLIAVHMAESLSSFAPSFNGRTEDLALLIAPYLGDAPPEEVRRDAEAFAYPYAVVSRSEMVQAPRHRSWSEAF